MRARIPQIVATFFLLLLCPVQAQLDLNDKETDKVMQGMQKGRLDESARYDALIGARDLLLRISANKEAQKSALVLDLLADHQAMKDRPLPALITSQSGAAGADRLDLDRALLLRLSHLLKTYSPDKIGEQEAASLLQIASYIGELEKRIDRFPAAERAEIKKMAHGILNNLARVAHHAKVEEKTARNFAATIRAMTAARGLLPQGTPISPYLVPGLIAGEMAQQTRRAILHAGETLSYFPQVLQGDKEALKKMLESAEGMKDALGKKKYGDSVLNTLPSKILEELPFMRYLADWFGIPDLEQMRKFRLSGDLWASSWGHFRFAGGQVVPLKGDFMERWQITLRLGYVSGTRVTGSYEINDFAKKETGSLVLEIAPEDIGPDGKAMRMVGWRYPDQSGRDRVKWSASRVK